MGAWRLAIASLDPRPWAELERRSGPPRDPVDRPLEDGGQPAPNALGAGRLPRLRGRMDPAVRIRPGLERVRPLHNRAARPAAVSRRDRAAMARDLDTKPPARHWRGPLSRSFSDRV